MIPVLPETADASPLKALALAPEPLVDEVDDMLLLEDAEEFPLEAKVELATAGEIAAL